MSALLDMAEGKDIRKLDPRRPVETLLTETQLWLQIAWSWSVTIGSVILGSFTLESNSLGWPAKGAIILLCWILVVSRTRGLLHTFHYTNHGASGEIVRSTARGSDYTR
jgi:hypothetical protein